MCKQKGFATLEIILVMLIISTLAGIVLPKMMRIMDTATLDYEVKKFRSEFLFARSLSRSATFDRAIFSSVGRGDAITLHVRNKSYEVNRGIVPVGANNVLTDGFSIYMPNKKLHEITFIQGKVNGLRRGTSATYTFTSPLGKERSLRLDSVGRLRIDKSD